MKLFRILLCATLALVMFSACSSDESTNSESADPSEVLFINEFLASNDASNADENGEYDDWIEIYNSGDEDIDLAGYYISDDLEDALSCQIPEGDSEVTTIEAGGYMIIWCDKQPEQGSLHVEIKLSGDGEDIVLTSSDGVTEIDSYTYEAGTTDQSVGRATDGGDTWTTFDTPTPGTTNN